MQYEIVPPNINCLTQEAERMSRREVDFYYFFTKLGFRYGDQSPGTVPGKINASKSGKHCGPESNAVLPPI